VELRLGSLVNEVLAMSAGMQKMPGELIANWDQLPDFCRIGAELTHQFIGTAQ
jgi:hypothetical protein